MVKFVCTLCGRCCMGMGRHVRITGMIGQNRYAVHHAISGEICYSTVAPRFRNEIRKGEEEGWCPFLCEMDEDGCRKYYCAIYDSAPKFCRDFKCCTARILGMNGAEKGRIQGRRTFLTDDESLRELWDSHNELNEMSDEVKWVELLGNMLKSHGYLLEIYE